MADDRDRTETERPTVIERVLRVVTEVRPGEGAVALLLSLNVFLLLTAYYVIKPVREALILAMQSGAEYKSYLGAAIAIALGFVVPIYARFADRLEKHRLVAGATLFFASHLVLFYLASLLPALRTNLGLVFYVWVGIFNMMVVAQFWAFSNDVYDEEQGKRLFPLVAVGQTAGAAAGSGFGIFLAESLGVYTMLLLGAVLLAACAGLTLVVHGRVKRSAALPHAPKHGPGVEQPSREGAFKMVFRYRYLTYLALFMLLFTFVNTNGEYMLGVLVKEHASALEAAGELGDVPVRDFIGGMYSRFFFWVNLLCMVLQAFVVSRLVKYGGIGLAFFVLPTIALLDASAVAIVPVLAVIWVGKIAENSVDYSINNTVRNMLWLPTTRDMKYKAKQAIDSFFVRAGDVTSALAVFLLADRLAMPVARFALLNVASVIVWVFLARAILREMNVIRAQVKRGPVTTSGAPA